MRLIPPRLWAMAVLSGILQVLPFSIAGPTPLWRTAFCWIALLPLIWALIGNTKTGNLLTLLQGAALGYASGFIWYLGNCYWIYQTMNLYGGLSRPIAAGILNSVQSLSRPLPRRVWNLDRRLPRPLWTSGHSSAGAVRLGRRGAGSRSYHRSAVGLARRRPGRQPATDTACPHHRSLRTLFRHSSGQRTLAGAYPSPRTPIHSSGTDHRRCHHRRRLHPGAPPYC